MASSSFLSERISSADEQTWSGGLVVEFGLTPSAEAGER
jgi:hypothetical protein